MVGVRSSMASVASVFFSLMGVLISLMSVGMLGVWVGMEFSFMSVLCFSSGSSVNEAESVIKYYVIQVFGSMIWSLGLLMMVNLVELSLSQFILLLGLFVKLGVFPFHFWVGPVVSSLSWSACLGILFLQKITPLWVLSNYIFLYKEYSKVELLCCLTCLVGCLGGLNVLNYRVLIGFSSIQNLGSMILLSCCKEFELFIYVLVYFVMMGAMVLSMDQIKIFSFQDLVKDKNFKSYSDLWWVSLYFMSSAGLPPLLGCSLKVVLVLGCWQSFPLGVGFCLMTSMVSLVFYLGVVISTVVFWGKLLCFNEKKSVSLSKTKVVSLLVNLVGGFLVFLVVSL